MDRGHFLSSNGTSGLSPANYQRSSKIISSYEEVIKQVQNEERHYAIVLTHSHDLDLEIIATLAKILLSEFDRQS